MAVLFSGILQRTIRSEGLLILVYAKERQRYKAEGVVVVTLVYSEDTKVNDRAQELYCNNYVPWFKIKDYVTRMFRDKLLLCYRLLSARRDLSTCLPTTSSFLLSSLALVQLIFWVMT